MARKDIGIALWVVFLWATNLIAQKIAVTYMSIFVLTFLRVAVALPFLLLVPKPQKRLWKYMVCGFFLCALYLILFGFGLQTDIGAGLASFIIQFQVFFAILCCFLILGEKPTWFQIMGILVSVVGIYFLKESSSSEFPLLGIGLLVASCFSYGLGIALSKKYKIGETMGDVVWLSAVAVLPLLLSCFAFEGPVQTFELILNIPLLALYCVLFAGLFSTLWGSYLWLKLLHRTPASSVVPFMLLLPIFSNILSYVILGESLTSQQMLSGFIIIVGVMFAQGIHKFIPRTKQIKMGLFND